MAHDGDDRIYGAVSWKQSTEDVSTHEFKSPRGCRETFGSVGTAQAMLIEADFTGTDCQLATFTGRVVLAKG